MTDIRFVGVWSVGLVLMMSLFVGCQSSDMDPPQGMTTVEGAQLFQIHCSICHGMNSGARPMVELFQQAEANASAEQFTHFLRQPQRIGMPPFPPSQITDAQIDALYQWLLTETTEANPPS